MNITAALAALEGQAGYQSPGGTNGENPFTQWQTDGLWQGAAFCDSFAQWGAAGNGGFVWQDNCQFGPRGDAYCPWTINHAQELGLWQGANADPQPGWQVLYDWNFNGVADHIGTVVEDRGDGTFVTIEGNVSGGQVKYCLRDRTYVMGFVALVDDPVPSPPPLPAPQHYDAPDAPGFYWVAVKPYPSGSSIGYVQQLFNEKCGHSLSQDGEYGPATRSAVVDFQQYFGLEPDGVVGPVTWDSIRYIADVTGFTG